MRDVDALAKVIQKIEIILCEHIEAPRAVTDPEETIGRIFEMMDRTDAVSAADRIEAGLRSAGGEVRQRLCWKLSGDCSAGTNNACTHIPNQRFKRLIMQQRRHFKQTRSIEERLAERARRFRHDANAQPPGPDRDALMQQARHVETGASFSEWLLSSPRLPPLE